MLFGVGVTRILNGMEYFSKSVVAPPVQTTHVGKVTCRPHKPAGFELAFNHYRYRLAGKYKLPETGKVMSRFGPVDATNSKSLPWPTLTHSRLSDGTDNRIDQEQDGNLR